MIPAVAHLARLQRLHDDDRISFVHSMVSAFRVKIRQDEIRLDLVSGYGSLRDQCDA